MADNQKRESIRSADPETIPSLQRSLLTGGLGFGLVSFVVFSTVAFAGRWMYTQLGALGAYVTWTALFIVLGGAVLGSLAVGRWRLPKFYLIFGLAFFAYATGWVGSYFAFGGLLGEFLGSLVGSILLSSVLAFRFGTPGYALKLFVWLFLANSVGYFLGSALNNYVGGRAGMLLWGIVYGLFLGSGLGAVIHLAQIRRVASTSLHR